MENHDFGKYLKGRIIAGCEKVKGIKLIFNFELGIKCNKKAELKFCFFIFLKYLYYSTSVFIVIGRLYAVLTGFPSRIPGAHFVFNDLRTLMASFPIP
ncbi:hypothetical protein D3C80_1599190 [compost metagenome]